MMKPRQRQAVIIDYLQFHGKTSVEDLAGHFALTGTTIRKDLTQLEEEGAVIRTYGGVVLSCEEGDQPIDRKTHINTAKKHQIARRSVLLIKDERLRIANIRGRQHGVANGALAGAVQQYYRHNQ